MEDIAIVKGNPKSTVGGRLNRIALDNMAYPLIGSKDETIIEKTLEKLWKLKSNRFSHQYAFEARLNEKTVGIITCYPASIMNKMAWQTVKQLIQLRKWELVGYSVMHLREMLSMVTLNEARKGEYYIGTLATLPESRGYGIGSKLIFFAEEQARLLRCDRSSLTVRKENTKALKLYEKLGYQILDTIDTPCYSLYRMGKKLTSDILS